MFFGRGDSASKEIWLMGEGLGIVDGGKVAKK